MEQTPLRDYFNADLLALVPVDATRVVEVGCGSGAMAREYRKRNPACQYVGIEIDPVYADASRFYCDEVLVGSIESLSDEVFKTLFPSSCWIFGDVLEHLYDPWAVLRRIRASIAPKACIVACLPNAQHWSVQARLNCGEFVYEDLGLMDRTHIRWFTRKTALRLFESTGFRVVEGGSVVVQETHREAALAGVRAFAQAIGTDVETAANDATAFQWLIRAVPA
jgi:SAM-dependent methyltransferase